MRSKTSYVFAALLLSLGLGSTSAHAQISLSSPVPVGGGTTTTSGASCQITSLVSTKGTYSTMSTMYYSCSGRFASSNVTAQIQHQSPYSATSLSVGIAGTVSKSLAVPVVTPGRALCSKDSVSLISFCDASPTTTTAPNLLACLKDMKSGRFYCPSWQTVSGTTSTGLAAGTSLAAPTSLLPVGPPSTVPGTGSGILPSGYLKTTITSNLCWSAVATVQWIDDTGTWKSAKVTKKPTNCP